MLEGGGAACDGTVLVGWRSCGADGELVLIFAANYLEHWWRQPGDYEGGLGFESDEDNTSDGGIARAIISDIIHRLRPLTYLHAETISLEVLSDVQGSSEFLDKNLAYFTEKPPITAATAAARCAGRSIPQ